MRRGSREGRRLLLGCLAVGMLIGAVATLMVVAGFGRSAEYVRCNPAEPRDITECPVLDVVGFELNSKLEAALTVGPVVALVVTVFAVVFVLSTTESRRD